MPDRACVTAALVGLVAAAALGFAFDAIYRFGWSHREIFWGAVVGAIFAPVLIGCYDRSGR